MFRIRKRLLLLVAAVFLIGGLNAQQSTISGTVTDAANGNPIAGASVVAFGSNSPTGDSLIYFARTDLNGFYSMDSVFAGQYLLAAEAGGFTGQSQFAVVSPNAPAQVDFQLAPLINGNASISGNVLDSLTGNGIANATLTLMGNGFLNRAFTNNQGIYVFQNVFAGVYNLQVEAPGYLPSQIFGIQVDSSDITGLNVWLLPDSVVGSFASLSGFVSDSLGPLYPATIDLLGFTANGDTVSYSTVNDSSGFYQIGNIAAGIYDVTATVNGYAPQVVAQLPLFDPFMNLDFYFGRGSSGGGGHLHGMVVDSLFGHPIDDATVELISYNPATGDSLYFRTITDLSGSFFFDNIPNATYSMITRATGYQTSFRTVEVSNALPGFIHVGLLRTTPVDAGFINGNVSFDGSGLPADGAVLDFLNNAGVAYRAYAGPTGLYSAQLPPGDYIVSCSYYYYYPNYFGFYSEYYDDVQDLSNATTVSVVAFDTVSAIDFGIPDSVSGRTVTVRGQVTDNSGNTLENAVVTLQAFDNPPGGFVDTTVYRALTDASGQYQMVIDLTYNNFDIYVGYASKDGYDTEFWYEQPSIHLADPIFLFDDSLLQDISFTLSPTNGGSQNSISGTVTDDSSGAALGGAFVVSSNTVTGELRFAFTDPAGGYTLDGLANQPHLLLYAANGFIPEFYDNALIWEDATPIIPSGVTGGINAALSHFRNDSTSGRITGVVSDLVGQPIAGVLLTIIDDQNKVIGYDFSDGQGEYNISGMHNGNFTIQASKVTYNSAAHNVLYSNPASGGLMMFNINLSNTVTAVEPVPGSLVPTELQLQANYPNPFNPSTTISFGLPQGQNVSLIVYNLLGQKVRTLFQGRLDAGIHQLQWNGRNDGGEQVSSGIYFYALETQNGRIARRMLLNK